MIFFLGECRESAALFLSVSFSDKTLAFTYNNSKKKSDIYTFALIKE